MYSFKDILEIKNGKNQRTVEDPNGRYPIYGSGGIIGYANDYICNADTVIIGRKGNINKPIFVNEPFWNVDTAFGLEANRELLLPKYLYYFCRHFDFEKMNKAVTIPSLTKSDLLEIIIDLPTIAAQTEIVNLLSKIERIIEIQMQELNKLDELMKARFVELFGIPIENSKGWDVEKAVNVCEVVTDGSHFSPEGKESGYPMLSVKDMKSNGFSYENCKYVDRETYELLERQGCVPYVNDVLVAKDGSYFTRAFAIKEFKEQAILSSIGLYRPDTKKVLPDFLADYLMSDKVIEFVNNGFVSGSALRRVIIKGLKEIPVYLPPIELQKEYVTLRNQIDKSKSVVQQSIKETQLLFDSLMQKYFG